MPAPRSNHPFLSFCRKLSTHQAPRPMRRTASHSSVCIPGDCHTPAIRSSVMDREHLNPAQCEVVDDLMQFGAERPTFRHQLRAELRDLLESSLAEIVRPPGIGERTWVNKA